MSNENKYQVICDTLKARIVAGFYVGKLPSRRLLMQEFKVSSRTLHKVFMQLKMLGIIEPSPTGTMICRQGSKADSFQPKIVLITPVDPAKHIADHFIQSIIANIRKYEFELVWSVCAKNNTLEMLKAQNLTSKDSVIFTNSTFAVESGNYLKENNITFVSANRPAMGVDINWVDWNHLELFDDVIGYLVSRGARYITFFGSGCSAVGGRVLPDNHWQILDDFEAVKKSYLLFYPGISEQSEELYSDAEKYTDYLLTLKHLPDVIWCGGNKTKEKIAKNLLRKGIKPGRIFLLCMSHIYEEEKELFGIYTQRSLQKMGSRVWELLMFSRLYPDVPCRGIKQHCEFLYNKSIKKIKFNQH